MLGALRRDLGIADGPAGAARCQELAQACQAGTLQADGRRLWERANVAYGLWFAQRQQDPAVAEVATPSAPEAAARAALGLGNLRIEICSKQVAPAALTDEHVIDIERGG